MLSWPAGCPACAIVKKYTWLGAYVNGNNPWDNWNWKYYLIQFLSLPKQRG